MVPGATDTFSTAPQSLGIAEARRAPGRFQLPKLSVQENRLLSRSHQISPPGTAQPGIRRLNREGKTSSEQVMLEIVKK